MNILRMLVSSMNPERLRWVPKAYCVVNMILTIQGPDADPCAYIDAQTQSSVHRSSPTSDMKTWNYRKLKA